MRRVVVFFAVFCLAAACQAETIYVDAGATGANNGSSWVNAYKCLQNALTAAGSGDSIWVAQGTYRPDKDTNHPNGTNDRAATFQLKNSVAIYGGFPGGGGLWSSRDPNIYETVLSGDIGVAGNGDNCYHVITGSYTNSTAILDGFTISGGNAWIIDAGDYDRGGGMFNIDGSPTIANCTFSGNSATYGGGICNANGNPTLANCTFIENSSDEGGGMYNYISSPTINNCTFSGNSASNGGGMYDYEYSSPTITNCTFSGNSARDGAGMYNENSSPTLIDCTFSGNSASAYGGGMFSNGSNPVLTNCTFSGNSASAFYGGGMCNFGSDPTLANCTFIENSSDEGGGMYNCGLSDPTVTNCTFSGNSAGNSGGGMRNWYVSSPTITNCTFSGNSASGSGGGMCDYKNYGYDSNTTITNCILWGNTAPAGAQIYNETGYFIVSLSDVEGGWAGTGNINEDPLFIDADGPDNILGTADDNLRLLSNSPCIDTGNNYAVPTGIETDLDGRPRFTDGDCNGSVIVDMGAYEYYSIIFVDAGAMGANNGTSWSDAYKYLQDAISAAEPNQGIKIWVAQGMYLPDENTANPDGTNDQYATFQLKNGVAIYGGFPSGGGLWNSRDPNIYQTIFNGNIGDAGNGDNCYHVITGSYTNSTAILDGFTITAGNASGPYEEDGYGGGMYNYSGSPTVINCTFSGNSANNGGGIYNRDESNPALSNCTFSGNSAGAGGGMCNVFSSPTLADCTFIGNSSGEGGGMYNSTNSSPIVINCTFSGNSATNLGGGMRSYYTSCPAITNCTFSGNSALNYGGGICDFGACSTTITNCIFWGNTAPTWAQIYNDINFETVSFSDVDGGWEGTGNIDANPLFVDADGLDNIMGTADDNLRLLSNSPCIDTGNNYAVPTGIETDLDGRDRFVDGDCNTTVIVDMGAYEFNYAYAGDFDSDCEVDFFDYAILADSWQQSNPLVDIAPPPAGDGIVDMNDLAVLCDNWLAGK